MFVTIAKFTGLLVLALLALVGCQTIRNSGTADLPTPSTETLRIGTYNVHYIILERDTGPWSRGDWDRRKKPLDLAFEDLRADVIGFQEMESFSRGSEGAVNLTLDWLLANNPD